MSKAVDMMRKALKPIAAEPPLAESVEPPLAESVEPPLAESVLIMVEQ